MISSIMEGNDYYTQDLLAENMEEYQKEIGSHAYMPTHFLGMSTEDLGFSRTGQSPFLDLKAKLLTDTSISIEDRMQGIRYLCSIPYNNGTMHCVEVVKHLITDPTVDAYKKFHFINTKEKYLRLDDHVAHHAYPLFFQYGLIEGGAVVPVELMFFCAEYIFHSFSADDNIRQSVLNWCLDILSPPEEREEIMFEDFTTQMKVCRFLLDHGQADEADFVTDYLQSLHIETPEDVPIPQIESIARGILRNLVGTYQYADNLNAFLDELVKNYKAPVQAINVLMQVFNEYYVDQIQGAHIASLVYQAMGDLQTYEKNECMLRIVRETLMYDEPTHDMLYSLLAILDGFVEQKPFKLESTPLERLRNEIFAALNHRLSTEVPEDLRNEVFESIRSPEKTTAKEFLAMYSVEEELWEMNQKDMRQDEFEDIYKQVIREWLGY